MWTTFKVFIEFVTNILFFMFWFFGCEARGILAPWPGIKLASPALEGKVLTTGPPGKSHQSVFNSHLIWLYSSIYTFHYSPGFLCSSQSPWLKTLCPDCLMLECPRALPWAIVSIYSHTEMIALNIIYMQLIFKHMFPGLVALLNS